MNFGGFMSRTDLEFSSGKGNTRQDYIEEMIAESKKRKFENQKDKQEQETKTKDLDQKWKDMAELSGVLEPSMLRKLRYSLVF